MKKLFRALCVAFAVWLTTVPALADIIWEPLPHDPSPERYANEPSFLVVTLVLGVVVIAAAILARTVIRKRGENNKNQDA